MLDQYFYGDQKVFVEVLELVSIETIYCCGCSAIIKVVWWCSFIYQAGAFQTVSFWNDAFQS